MQSNLTEITLWDGCSPVNFLHIFRLPLLKNTSGGLLLVELFPAKYYFGQNQSFSDNKEFKTYVKKKDTRN